MNLCQFQEQSQNWWARNWKIDMGCWHGLVFSKHLSFVRLDIFDSHCLLRNFVLLFWVQEAAIWFYGKTVRLNPKENFTNTWGWNYIFLSFGSLYIKFSYFSRCRRKFNAIQLSVMTLFMSTYLRITAISQAFLFENVEMVKMPST
jgi:hypothetical protein